MNRYCGHVVCKANRYLLHQYLPIWKSDYYIPSPDYVTLIIILFELHNHLSAGSAGLGAFFYWSWNYIIYDDNVLWPLEYFGWLFDLWPGFYVTADLQPLWTNISYNPDLCALFFFHLLFCQCRVAVAMAFIVSRLVELMFFSVSCFRVSLGTQCSLLQLRLMELVHPQWKRGKWVTVPPTLPHLFPPLVVTSSPERYRSALLHNQIREQQRFPPAAVDKIWIAKQGGWMHSGLSRKCDDKLSVSLRNVSFLFANW